MPRSRLVNPGTLVRGAAEILKIPIDILPIPGKMMIGKGVDATAAVVAGRMDRTRFQQERQEALGEFETAISQTNATIIRTGTWLRRVIHQYPNATGLVVQITPRLAKEYREIRRQLLDGLDDVESATLSLSPYLTDNDRGLLDRDIADLRGVVHDVLCPEVGEAELSIQEADRRMDRLRSVGRRLETAVEGLSR